MTHTTTPADIATQYLAVWNERDAAARRALVARAFSIDASYVDPMMRGAGHDGIDAMIAGAQGQFPGYRFELTARRMATTTWYAFRGPWACRAPRRWRTAPTSPGWPAMAVWRA